MNRITDPKGKRLQELLTAISREYDRLPTDQQADVDAWLQAFRETIQFSDNGFRSPSAESIESPDGPSQFMLPDENPNPVLRPSFDGRVLYANPAAQDLIRHWDCLDRGTAADFWQTVAD